MLYAVVEAFGHLLMRLQRSTLNPLGPTLILLGALAASVMATPAAGQSWPIKQFEVRALEPAGSTGAVRDDLLARISRMAGVDPDSIEKEVGEACIHEALAFERQGLTRTDPALNGQRGGRSIEPAAIQ